MSALGDGVFVPPDRQRAAGAAGFCLCEERYHAAQSAAEGHSESGTPPGDGEMGQ